MDNTRHAMVIRADARAMGAITAISTRKRTLGARTRTVALSECISYNPSNGQSIDSATVFTPTRKRNTRSKVRTINADLRRAAIDRALMADMGTIHGGAK